MLHVRKKEAVPDENAVDIEQKTRGHLF
jgi:hypothetical protein